MPRIDALWYDLELRARDWEGTLKNSERSWVRFTQFVKAHPVAVGAAVAAGLAAVATQAVKMAGETDAALRLIQNRMPDAVGRTEELRRAMMDVRRESGRLREEVRGAAVAMSQQGLSADEFARRLQFAATAADATGADLAQTTERIDFLGDAFNLTGQELEDTFAIITQIAQGKVPIEDLFAVFERGGSTLASLGVDAKSAAAAMVALVDAGVPMRQAGTSLTSILDKLARAAGQDGLVRQVRSLGLDLSETGIRARGLVPFLVDLVRAVDHDTESLRALGFEANDINVALRLAADGGVRAMEAASLDATEAQRRLAEQADRTRESIERQLQRIKGEYDDALEELGVHLLPLVTDGFESLLDALRGFGSRQEKGLLGGLEATLGRTKDDVLDLLALLAAASGDADALLVRKAQRERQRGPQGVDPGLLQRIGGRDTGIDLTRPLGGFGQSRPQPTPTGPTSAGAPRATGRIEDLDKDDDKLKARLERRKQLLDDLRQQLAATTQTAVDDLETALTALEQRVREAFGTIPPEAKQAFDAAKREIANTKFLEGIDREIEALEPAVRRAAEQFRQGFGQAATTEILPRLEAVERSLEQQLRTLDPQTKLYAEVRDRLTEVRALYGPLTADMANANVTLDETATKTQTWLERLQSVAETIGTVGTAVLQVADSLGVVDDQTRRVLQGFISIGQHIPKALSGDLTGIVGLIGGLGSLIGGLFGGESPEDRARREALERNTDAIEALADEIGNVSLDIAGSEFARLSRKLLGVDANREFIPAVFEGDAKVFKRLIESLGLSLEDVRAFAESLGLELVLTEEGFRQLQEAIRAVELTTFSTTFAGQRDLLRRRADVFDLDTAGQLGELIELLSERSTVKSLGDRPLGSRPRFGALGDALTGVDLSSIAGLKAAQDRLRALFEGFEDLTPAQLGELTPEQFLDALAEAQNLIAQRLRDLEAEAETDIDDPADGIGEALRTLQDVLSELALEFAVFNVTDPVAQFRRLREEVGELSPALAQALAGLDLSTAAGRAAAQQALQQLFLRPLSKEQLGALTEDDFRALLAELDQLVDAAVDQAAEGSGTEEPGEGEQTEGFAVRREITEVTGSRLLGVMTSVAVYSEEIAHNTAVAAAALDRLIGPITPLTIPADALGRPAAGPAVIVQVGDINVSFQVGEGALVPAPAQAAARIADHLEAELGTRLLRQLAVQGFPLTTGAAR